MEKYSGIVFFSIIYSLNCICNENFEIFLEYEKNCFNIDNILKYNIDKKGNTILKGYLEINYSFIKKNLYNISTVLKNIYDNKNISYIILKRRENFTKFYLFFSQYKTKYENIINIDFIECENNIRNFNHINQSEILYLIQLYKSDFFYKNKYEYQYIIINQNNKILNLNVCDMKIKFTYPLKLLNLKNDEYILVHKLYKKNINIFDSKSPFFNDICFRYSYKNKDIILDDRRKIFYKYYPIFNGCTFKTIDFDKNISICLCPINIVNYNTTFKKIILQNIQIIKCYNNFFNKEIYKNIGFYIQLIFLIVTLTTEFFWCYITLKNINERILEIITIKTKNNLFKDNSHIIPFIKNYSNQIKSSIKSQIKITSRINSPKLILNSNLDLSKNSLNNSNLNHSVCNTQLSNNINNITIIKNPSTFFEKKSTIHKCININEIRNEIIIKKEIKKQNHLLLIYWEMLKIHHYIFNFNFYHFQIIPNYSKSFYIINSINTFFLSNIITYSKSYIHKTFEYNGTINSFYFIFKYQYYKIFESIFFHFIINFPLSLLSYYTFIKAESIFLNENKKIIQIIRENKLLKQKITIYFSLISIINIFSIYYITIFCNIFRKIQLNFILLSLISIIIQSILSIFIIFIISIIFINSKIEKYNKTYI